jgi:hypothetical protein
VVVVMVMVVVWVVALDFWARMVKVLEESHPFVLLIFVIIVLFVLSLTHSLSICHPSINNPFNQLRPPNSDLGLSSPFPTAPSTLRPPISLPPSRLVSVSPCRSKRDVTVARLS